MKQYLLASLVALLCCTPAVRAGNPVVVRLWPGKAPGETSDLGEGKPTAKGGGRVSDIVRPTLAVYRPEKSKDTGTTLIIAPGGAYQYLALDQEGEAIAKWCNSVDAVDKFSSRLNFAALIYSAGALGAKGDKGKNELTADTINKKNVPPLFFAVAADDSLANRTIDNFVAFKKAGVPAELHVYASGGHGFGIRPSNSPLIADWSDRLQSWMRHQKLLDVKK